MSIFDEPKIDCHHHVFDPIRFPYELDNFYYPAAQEIGTPAQFFHVLDAYGVGHALAVAPNSGYGMDNDCLLDAISGSDGRLKGVAMVHHDIPRIGLERLKARGIAGVALNPALLGSAHYADAAYLLKLLTELGMFAQIQVQGGQLLELLPMLQGSGARLLFDHCGRPDPDAGLDQPGFQALLALGRGGNCFVKLSGYAKFSRQSYPYEDTWPYVHALAEAFTLDACVWGSDWPFLRAPERIDYGPLLTLVARLFPEPDERRKLLWDTPRALFGFGPRATK